MSDPSVELLAHPAGPATLAAVKTYLHISELETRADDLLEDIVAAVNVKVAALPIAESHHGASQWRSDIIHGAVMLCARLYQRRNTAQGYEAFGDGGAVYIQRNDPDIAMLLELGAYAKPKIG